MSNQPQPFVGSAVRLILVRFWLVRLVHEHRSETDRLISALKDIESKLQQ